MQNQNYTPEQVTELLMALQQNDTQKIQQATAMLKVYFKRVEAVGTLMQLVLQSPEQAIRQLSCVYLRKVIV